MPFTAPHEADVVIVAKSAVSPAPKRTSFPSMFPAVGVDPGGLVDRVAPGLGPRRDAGPDEEEEPHRPEDGPAVARLPGHRAERVREPRRDREDEEHLEEVRGGGRVLVGVGGVRVEEAAAVRPELLDRLLRGDRAERDRLRRAVERRDLRRGREVLDDALRHQDDRGDEGDREEDPERRTGQVDPEVARSSSPRRARSRGSPRPRRRSRSRPRGSSGGRAPPSG